MDPRPSWPLQSHSASDPQPRAAPGDQLQRAISASSGPRSSFGAPIGSPMRSQRSCSDTTQQLALESQLHSAARRGNATLMQRKLDSALSPEAPDQDGRTLLHSAASGGSVKCVRLLLELGANAHATDGELDTPLHRAAIGGKPRRLLFSRTPTINFLCFFHMTSNVDCWSPTTASEQARHRGALPVEL